MKKLQLALIALVILAFPFSAQAKSCFWFSCDYIEDGQFYYSGTYWDEDNYVTYPLASNVCNSSRVAEIGNDSAVEQTFYVDDSFNFYELVFHPILLDDTDNWYDQLKVTVYNHTTNSYETFYLRGSSFSNSCNNETYTLSNDYDNDWVTVRFEVAYLSLSSWQIDNVQFWGHNY